MSCLGSEQLISNLSLNHFTSTRPSKILVLVILARNSKQGEAVGTLRGRTASRTNRFEIETGAVTQVLGPVYAAEGIIAGVAAVPVNIGAARECDLIADH